MRRHFADALRRVAAGGFEGDVSVETLQCCFPYKFDKFQARVDVLRTRRRASLSA